MKLLYKKNKTIPIILCLFFLNTLNTFSIHKDNHSKKKLIVAIIPLGRVHKRILKLIKNNIIKFYKIQAEILPRKRLPRKTYYRRRNRYNASRLLDYLEEIKPEKYFKVLGVTEKDIYTKKGKYPYWGIGGLGVLGGESCMISTLRYKRGVKSKKHFYERIIKAVLHELGHTFGLEHCEFSQTCMMRDAYGKISSIDKEKIELCEKCLKKVIDYLKSIKKINHE